MKQIKLLLLLASASVTGALAQSNGLTDMSQSRFAKMANTGISAVHWTDGFWGDRFQVFSRTSLQVCGTLGTRRRSLTVSVILRLLPVCARVNIGDLRSMTEICISGWKEWLLSMLSTKIRNWIS